MHQPIAQSASLCPGLQTGCHITGNKKNTIDSAELFTSKLQSRPMQTSAISSKKITSNFRGQLDNCLIQDLVHFAMH